MGGVENHSRDLIGSHEAPVSKRESMYMRKGPRKGEGEVITVEKGEMKWGA